MPEFEFQRKRLLEDRSRLVLEFPQHGGKTKKHVIPFYENPIVTEDQSANLVNYEPVGRAGSIFTYTGAKSRQISVTFNVTMDHVLEFYEGWLKYVNIFKNDSNEEKKNLFLSPSPVNNAIALAKASTSIGPTQGQDAKREFYELLAQEDLEGAELQDFVNSLEDTRTDRIVSAIVFWVNLVRSTVVNNSSDPTLGPPLVRLTHGVLYRQVPCICSKYKINVDEVGGYDVKSLLARKIIISLTLHEARFGDFIKYTPSVVSEFEDRDALTGWESIIGDPFDFDPGKVNGN